MSGFLGTRASTFSDIGLLLEIVTTVLFTVGYFTERRKGKHCIVMAGALTANVLFVISYMVKRLLEAAPSPPPSLKTIYLGIVIPHGLLSIVVLALAGTQAILGYMWRRKTSHVVTLGKRRSIHKRLGQITLILWYISLLTGVAVYTILYVL